MPTILPRTDTNPHGTVAVIIFIAGAIILVLVIILILLFIKKRHSGGGSKGFAPRLERGDGNAERGVGRYGKLEDDEEGAWSAEMEGAGVSGGLERERKGGYAPVHDESMGYQSQTMHHGLPDKDTYR